MKRGFSLVDAMLGLALLFAGMFGLLYAFQGSVSSSLLADQTVIASNLAQEALEKIAAQRDCNLSGCGYGATVTSINSGTYNASPVSGFPGYNLTVSAYEVSASDLITAQPGSGYARVTVVVSWNSGNNSISFVTLIASYTV